MATKEVLSMKSTTSKPGTKRPSVLFVCVHNAGRSQMAAAFLSYLSQGAIKVRSAGTQPASEVNPVAVEAIRPIRDEIQALVRALIQEIVPH